jgi:hypothetical protein
MFGYVFDPASVTIWFYAPLTINPIAFIGCVFEVRRELFVSKRRRRFKRKM